MARADSVTRVEIHGFLWWVASSVLYVLYLLWAYIPDCTLKSLGLTYYPSKHWAVALPAWLCVSVVYAYWAYESFNMMLAAPPAPGAPFRRDAAWRSIEEVGLASHFSAGAERIPPLVDIPPPIVDMVLLGGKSPREAERMYQLDIAGRQARRQHEQLRRAQRQQQAAPHR